MPKLPQGVRKRPDGKLEKRFTVSGKQYSVYGHTTKELAQKEADKRKAISENLILSGGKQSLSQYFEKWLDGKRSQVKQATIRLYRTHFDIHINPIIGQVKLCSLKRFHIVTVMEKAREQRSMYCANFCLQIMKQVLNQAVHDEMISKNPAEIVKYMPDKRTFQAVDTNHKAFTREEQNRFLTAIQGDYYEPFFRVLLLTGMRCGEAAALTWNDFDTKAGLIRINKTVTQAETGKAIIGDSPKTANSNRCIPITSEIKQCFTHQKKMLMQMFGLDAIRPEKRVFPSMRGKLIMASPMNAHLKVIFSRIGVERRTIHALRDSFATRFIESGGSPQVLKSLLGHTSFSMTMDKYSQVMDALKVEEMEKAKIV